jgi:hypothetical protein
VTYSDYPARLRELVGHCRRAAKASFELEAKASFRAIAEVLSTMAEEIERSGALKVASTSERGPR